MKTVAEIHAYLDQVGCVKGRGRKALVSRKTGFTPRYVGYVLDGKDPVSDRFWRLLKASFAPDDNGLPYPVKEAITTIMAMGEPMQYRAVAILKEMLLAGKVIGAVQREGE